MINLLANLHSAFVFFAPLIHGYHFDADKTPVAKISALAGEVRIRRAGSYSWSAAERNAPLSAGDKIFVSENAQAVVAYILRGGEIELGSGSLLELEETVPTQSRVLRGFAGRGKQAEGQPEFASETSQSNETHNSSNTYRSAPITVKRKQEYIPRLFPKGRMLVSLADFSKQNIVTVKFEVPLDIKGLNLTLWRTDTATTPYWSNWLGRSEFSNVASEHKNRVIQPVELKFGKAGHYVLVTTSDDDRYVTKPLEIVVASTVRDGFLGEGIKPGDVVVIP